MAAPLVVSESRTIALPQDVVFDAVVAMPLETLFDRRYGPFPAIRETRRIGEVASPWGSVGQERVVVPADPGSMVERLTAVDRPTRYAYALHRVKGPMRLLATGVEGAFTFAPTTGAGTIVTWTWTVSPAGLPGALAMPLFGRIWHGYASRALARFESLVLTSPPRS